MSKFVKAVLMPVHFVLSLKLRVNSSGDNRNGDTFIYMAFAENPLKFANAR